MQLIEWTIIRHQAKLKRKHVQLFTYSTSQNMRLGILLRSANSLKAFNKSTIIEGDCLVHAKTRQKPTENMLIDGVECTQRKTHPFCNQLRWKWRKFNLLNTSNRTQLHFEFIFIESISSGHTIPKLVGACCWFNSNLRWVISALASFSNIISIV